MSDDSGSEIPVVRYDHEAFQEASASYADENGGPKPWDRAFERRVLGVLQGQLLMLQDEQMRDEALQDLAQVVIPLALAEEMKRPIVQQFRELQMVVTYEGRKVRLGKALILLGKRAYADRLLLQYVKTKPAFEELEDEAPQDEEVEHGSLFDQAGSDDAPQD